MSVKKSLTVIALVTAFLLTGCSAVTAKPESTVAPTTPPAWESREEPSPTPEPTPGPIETPQIIPTPMPAETSAPAEKTEVVDAAKLLAREIPDQSFNVELDGWGKVRFSSIEPAEYDDVQFILTENGNLLYSFPDTSDNNKLIGVTFYGIEAISFKDFDRDGRADVVIQLRYEIPSGATYNSVRVYSQKNNQRSFSLDKYGYDIARYVILNGYSGDIWSIYEGIDECLRENGIEEAAATAEEIGNSNAGANQGTNDISNYAASELEGLLKSAITYVQPSSSGCTLRATEIAAKMLTWACDNNVSSQYTEKSTKDFIDKLDASEKDLFSTSISLVDYQRKLLQREDNTDVLSLIGWENKEINWSTNPVPAVEGIMTAAGQR